KRIFDLICSCIALILLSPFFIAISISIKINDNGPVFFGHKRIGKNGKEFKLYKFRSMVTNAEELIDTFTPEQLEEFKQNFKLENDPRITPIGKFLRKTSLDEIPQLINIIKGEMSIVGPRPVTEEETMIFGSYRDLMLSVPPGLTGYWAAYGRGDTTGYRRRRAMEVYYVMHRSVWLDIKIIFKTFVTVFTGKGSI
ncbi:MAG TPA: exopolysaccharide biosynthesis protein, partial [Ruminococcaceae bacterium]|nr:exopolysaccharide biosynthesis protein [Oscillospiraceae bacterium]